MAPVGSSGPSRRVVEIERTEEVEPASIGSMSDYVRELSAKAARIEAQNLSLIDEIEAIRQVNIKLQEEKAVLAAQLEARW